MNIIHYFFLFTFTTIQMCMGFQPSSPQKVAIVGAGLAGLTAAYRLQQAGVLGEVYEARERPGGRVYTVSIGNSHAELGGQSLEDGGEAIAIRKLIDEMGLSLETAWKTRVYSHSTLFNHHLDNAFHLIAEAPNADEALWNQLLSFSIQSQNLSEVLDRLFEGQNSKLRLYFEWLMRGYEGTDSRHLSVFYISCLYNFIKMLKERAQAEAQGEPSFFSLTHVQGGNSKLIEALANQLREHIHYRFILRKIKRNNNLIQLHFEGGKMIEAEQVILALPCSTLRDVEIEEGLFPPDQMTAIQTLHYGTNGKLLIPISFPSSPYPEIIATEHYVSWFNHDYSTLILYYGGSKGIFACQTQEEMKNKFLEELPSIQFAYPEARFLEEISPIGISWFHEEFSKGSYSTLSVHQEKIFLDTMKIADEPVKVVFRPIHNQIFFAGEHTSIDAPATLEGAVESGEKAARLILAL